MSKAIVTLQQARLATLLTAAVQAAPQTGSAAFMKFAKGDWSFGADETEVGAKSLWAVNPNSFCQGYIIWEDSEVVEEKMAALGQPIPVMPAGADAQVAFELLCTEGEHVGTHTVFKTSSRGGRNAVLALIKSISAQAAAGESFVPVCGLASESYKHKTYGKIHTPVFEVVTWIMPDDLGSTPVGDDEPKDEVETAPAKTEEPTRRRQRGRA